MKVSESESELNMKGSDDDSTDSEEDMENELPGNSELNSESDLD